MNKSPSNILSKEFLVHDDTDQASQSLQKTELKNQNQKNPSRQNMNNLKINKLQEQVEKPSSLRIKNNVMNENQCLRINESPHNQSDFEKQRNTANTNKKDCAAQNHDEMVVLNATFPDFKYPQIIKEESESGSNSNSNSKIFGSQESQIQEMLCESVVSEYISQGQFSQQPSSIENPCKTQISNHNNCCFESGRVQTTTQQKPKLSALSLFKEQELEKPVFLTLMVLGAKGLGKSTFIDTFMHRKFKKEDKEYHIRQSTQEIIEQKGQRQESSTILNLNMIDTPGYPDAGDISSWMDNIMHFITDKFNQHQDYEDEYLKDRKSVQQEDDKDQRIHACLYFFGGPRIQQRDFIIISHLQGYVNVIPILAKGDCYILEEIKQMKIQILQEGLKHNIKWFDCETVILIPLQKSPEILQKIRNGPFGTSPPFLLVSSENKDIENSSQFVRKYPWGVCKVEDPEHSDFVLLYQLLIGFFLPDFRQFTEFNYKQFLREKKRKEKQLREEKHIQKQQIIYNRAILTALGIGAVFGFFQMRKSVCS